MIAGPRLLLRPFAITDAPKLLAMSHEAGLRRWIPDQVYRDLAHAEQIAHTLAGLTSLPPDPLARPFVLGVEQAGVLIGHVGLSGWRGSVEIGYAVEERVQGLGLATEAVAAMATWGLGLGLVEILGVVHTDNVVSRRVLAKVGFAWRSDDVDGRGQPIQIYRFPAG